MIMYLLHY